MQIDIHNMHVFIGDSHVLQGLSLRVGGGQRVVLIGRNGAGKTTLARAVVGLAGPSTPGTLRIEGDIAANSPLPIQDISGSTAWERHALGLAYVPQGRRVFASLSVEENLQVAARAPRYGSEPVWALEYLYALFPRLKERRRQPASVLSGGEQQMLAIARALSGHPRILVLDEPTEGLSPLMVDLVQRTLEKVNENGVDILLFEQNLKMAASMAQRLHVLQSGRIIHSQDNVNETQMRELAERYLSV
jgi:branched-chain amino acid transport system ATP-binding protein